MSWRRRRTYENTATTPQLNLYVDGELAMSYETTNSISAGDLFSLGQEYDAGKNASVVKFEGKTALGYPKTEFATSGGNRPLTNNTQTRA